jgi:hypothetical protein
MSRSPHRNKWVVVRNMPDFEARVANYYAASDETSTWTKSDECQALMYNLTCAASTYHLQVTNSTCAPIKVCFEWCAEYLHVCNASASSNAASMCENLAAPKGAACFRSSGVTTTMPVATTRGDDARTDNGRGD